MPVKHQLEMDKRHRYTCKCGHTSCTGKVFQSVTTILGKAVPKNLAWHGQTRGVIGVKGLLRIPKYPNVKAMKSAEVLKACADEGIHGKDDAAQGRGVSLLHRAKLSAVPKYDIAKMSPVEVTDALKREHLTVNDHRDQAAAGGTIVHKALEDYATKGIIPNASAVPESKRGSIRGLAKFIVEYKPEFVATEVRTLSTEHEFAGTFDLLCKIRARLEDGKLIPDPEADPLTVLVDLKTSKWIYPASHFPQLEAYEGARIEAGEPPTDVRAVLWVNADGDMELVPSTASFDDFLRLKASADVIGRLDKSWKRPRKVRTNA